MRAELRNRLTDLIVQSNLEPVSRILLEESKECVRLFRSEAADPNELGGSRIGGLPDLPDGVEWPKGRDEEGRPGYASFIAQFHLAEVPSIQDLPIPREGRIWLFLNSLWDDQGRIEITGIYESKPDVRLRRLAAPTGAHWSIAEQSPEQTALRFEVGVSLPVDRPGFEDELYERFASARSDAGSTFGGSAAPHDGGVDEQEIRQRIGRFLLHGVSEPPGSLGRIGGHAFSSDGGRDLLQLIVLTRRGQRRPTTKWIDQNFEEVAKEAELWRLLVVLFRGIAFEFGEAFPLWVFARASDLAGGRFDSVAAEGGHS
jgi:hypothetical protein